MALRMPLEGRMDYFAAHAHPYLLLFRLACFPHGEETHETGVRGKRPACDGRA
jgi:hypothetical protein